MEDIFEIEDKTQKKTTRAKKNQTEEQRARILEILKAGREKRKAKLDEEKTKNKVYKLKESDIDELAAKINQKYKKHDENEEIGNSKKELIKKSETTNQPEQKPEQEPEQKQAKPEPEQKPDAVKQEAEPIKTDFKKIYREKIKLLYGNRFI